ncbi:hypothetical protein [Celeribacter sp.]|uniref:hypothetical protein n=1 Tax=Celeribacter sp. TaxID=1890673 RepID=UPI003A945559
MMREHPFATIVSDAPEDFVPRQLKGLVGFESVLQEPKGVWKVSQNTMSPDRMGGQAGLRSSGRDEDKELAERVQARAMDRTGSQ